MSSLKTHNLKGECPTCGYRIDAHSTLESEGTRAPQKGDISICLKCTSYNEFDEDLNLIKLTEESKLQLPPAVLEVMEKAAEMLRQQNKAKMN